MLISFSVENFKSIRDLQTISMEAQADNRFETGNVFPAEKHRLVKSAAIYGPNASGKSNVVAAMIWLRQFVLNSSKEGQAGEVIDIQPFRLSTVTEKAPTHFEIEFLWKSNEYRYGFELTAERVISEWLFRKSPAARTVRLYTREGQKIAVSEKHFKEGKGLEKRTRDNALFLSVCSQFNGDVSGGIIEWMQRFRHVSGLSEIGFFAFTADLLQDARQRQKLLELAKKADFNIQSLRSEMEEVSPADLPTALSANARKRLERLMRVDIKTTHSKRDADGRIVGDVEFDLQTDESEGTQKFVALTGPITHTLDEGSILIVDELEARLHPLLTQAVVDLFHSSVNRRNAQLICATHDVTLMSPERFRRDQIWFCEKDETGATDLFSLSELDANQVRPTTQFSRQYLQGLFGAVPKLAHFQEAAADAIKE